MVKTIKEAEKALLPYVGLVGRVKKDMTLERIQPLMDLLGNPERRLAVVHVAGTSGKTSTSYFISALLSATGKRVGLTVSPHVDSITERVQINGHPISDKLFCELLDEFLKFMEQLSDKPSYFELMYAFALWVFDRVGVNYAVVETGMGGLHDATNVARRNDKVCVITDIGYDHMKALGNTLPQIASQKAGIIHKGNQVLMYRQGLAIMKAVQGRVKQKSAKLQLVDETIERRDAAQNFAGVPEFQQRNWLLAHAAYKYLVGRDRLPGLNPGMLKMTAQIQVPARMEQRALGGKPLVMDGAHNADKMKVFASSFKQLYPGIRPAVLLALKESKDYGAIMPVIADLSDHVIVTTFDTSQDLPARSIDPRVLSKGLKTAGIKNVEVIPDHNAALVALENASERALVITGSFYLLSQVRHALKPQPVSTK